MPRQYVRKVCGHAHGPHRKHCWLGCRLLALFWVTQTIWSAAFFTSINVHKMHTAWAQFPCSSLFPP